MNKSINKTKKLAGQSRERFIGLAVQQPGYGLKPEEWKNKAAQCSACFEGRGKSRWRKWNRKEIMSHTIRSSHC